jgi:hypothetical protein
MPKREVVQSIVLGRGTERIQLTTGQVFDFTDEELDELAQANPGAISKHTTIDLDVGDVDLKKVDAGDETKAAKAPKGKAKTETTDL